MLLPFHLRSLAIGVMILSTTSGDSCAGRQTPASLGIRLDADTVRLRRFPEGVALEARALVKNEESRAAYIVGCWPGAEREINGTWIEVFSPTCINGATVALSPGDSKLIPIALYGFTAPNMLPRLDPRAVPGRYRLVFWVTTEAPGPATGLTSPASSRRIESEPFIVRD
jgi:hypothetical protein